MAPTKLHYPVALPEVLTKLILKQMLVITVSELTCQGSMIWGIVFVDAEFQCTDPP